MTDERLAELREKVSDLDDFPSYDMDEAITEIERLRAELAEVRALNDKQCEINMGLADDADDVEQRIEGLRAELATHKQFARDTIDDMECLPKCDSYGHEDLCPVVNPLAAWRKLRAELAERERQYREIWGAIWCAMPSEYSDDGDDGGAGGDHESTLKEANRQWRAEYDLKAAVAERDARIAGLVGALTTIGKIAWAQQFQHPATIMADSIREHVAAALAACEPGEKT